MRDEQLPQAPLRGGNHGARIDPLACKEIRGRFEDELDLGGLRRHGIGVKGLQLDDLLDHALRIDVGGGDREFHVLHVK